MALEEIERLKEKIDKDPFSKLFVPLAEEYKKAGMYDEAIDVLSKGLERQPGYLSARVSLGKIYIERGLSNEARAEFERVIEVIPDNLYAHKKLAEIYKDLGEKDRAIREFKTVLRLNPMDEWAATSLETIQEEPKTPTREPMEEKIVGNSHVEPKLAEEARGKEPVEISSGEEGTGSPELRTEIAAEKMGEEKPSGASISEEDMRLWKAHTEMIEEAEEAEAAGEETTIEAEELSEEESISFEDIFKKPEAAVEEREEVVEEVSRQPALNIGDADQYIIQGKYSEAMNVYRNLLSSEPDNRQVLQRLDELRALLKMLGKDKEQLISRLDSFLGGIRKRRNEFFGST